MIKVCAWCRKEFGRVDSRAGTENLITHGICGNCRDNLVFQSGVDLGAFLDSLKLPIVMVDREGTIVTGNDQARTLLRKKLSEIEGYKGGEVFECAHARLPEGCGKTMHCSGCTIRRTVMETYGTGRSFLKVPASLNRKTPDDPERINLLISTEKLDDLVLLRIDEIELKDTAQSLAAPDSNTASMNRCR